MNAKNFLPAWISLGIPALGPVASYEIGGPNMALVKNWQFGMDGTIKNYADMNANFYSRVYLSKEGAH